MGPGRSPGGALMAELTPVSFEQVRFGGIVEREPTDAGLSLHRLPAFARAQVDDPAMALLSDMPAGGRLEVVTDATAIELDVQLTLLQTDDEPINAAVFDVEVDGEIVQTVRSTEGTVIVMIRATGGFDIRSGGSTTVRFDLPPGGKLVRIWLPNTAAPRLLA